MNAMLFAWLVAAVSGLGLRADTIPPRGSAPSFSDSSIVNAASNQAGPLSPNSIATIYGVGLAYGTASFKPPGTGPVTLLPTDLSNLGVIVTVGGVSAGLFYVSPKQINFLVPSVLLPGQAEVRVALDGIVGPTGIKVQIAAAAPAVFQLDAQTVIATRQDGSLIRAGNSAKGGDVIILYATGLGDVVPPLSDRQIAAVARPIKQIGDLRVLIDGVALPADQIFYAGVTPGFAGLYQINLRLPDGTKPNAEIRVAIGNQTSPPSLTLPND